MTVSMHNGNQHDHANDLSRSNSRALQQQQQQQLAPSTSRAGKDAAEYSNDVDDTATATEAAMATVFPMWHFWIAGGVAGFGSRIVTAPLDLIRIRRQLTPRTQYPSESFWQTWRNIVQTEGGITALFRGNMAALYLWVGYAAVQFSVYNQTKAYFQSLRYDPRTFRFVTMQEKCESPINKEIGSDNQTSAPEQRPLPSPIVTFGAGAVAGVWATLATYPFDVCRTTFAARGLVMSPLPTPPTSTTTSSTTRHHVPFSSLVEPSYHRRDMVIMKHTTTGVGGVVAPAPTVSPPIPLVRPPQTLVEFALQLYHQKGLQGFYAGAAPAVLQIIPYMGLNFCIYDALVASSSSSSSSIVSAATATSSSNDQDLNTTVVTKKHNHVSISAFAGSISGAVSKMLVYPMDTVKRRLQGQAFSYHFHDSTGNESGGGTSRSLWSISSSSSSSLRYRGMWDCIVQVWQQEGWIAFYRGIVPSVMKTAISSSLSFALFRWTKNILEGTHEHYHVHPAPASMIPSPLFSSWNARRRTVRDPDRE